MRRDISSDFCDDMVGETTDDRKRNGTMSYIIFIGVCDHLGSKTAAAQVIETTVVFNDMVLNYEIMVIYMFCVTTQELMVALGGLSIEMLLLLP